MPAYPGQTQMTLGRLCAAKYTVNKEMYILFYWLVYKIIFLSSRISLNGIGFIYI
jgi:hypothetical protein